MSNAEGAASTDSGFLPMIAASRHQSRGRAAVVPLSTLLSWGSAQLTRRGLAPVEAKWLLEWCLGVDSLILAEPEVGIRAAECYRSAIAQRRNNVPLQHITGSMSFRSLTLRAGPGVFSVRPETELIVDLGLAVLASGHAKVADLCAGSGAIGLSVAVERPQSEVVLVEIDETAARFLSKNVEMTGGDGPLALASGSSVEIRVEDATGALRGSEGTFDLVLTNPPYVGVSDAPTQQEAKADPSLALYGGGEDGLITPRGIVGRAFSLLAPGGWLFMEHGFTQGPALVDHAESVGFESARTIPDLTGTPRFLEARKGLRIEEEDTNGRL